MTPIDRYPLTWPSGQPRTPPHRRQQAAFKVDFGRARDEMLHSLELLGARSVLLSSTVALRRDGLPYANMPEPEDPGVAIYFDRKIPAPVGAEWRPFVIACDTYSKVKWNLRALGVTVEALRSIHRHGATTLLEQMFAGFAALPPKSEEAPWWTILEVEEGAPIAEVHAAYRKLAKLHHPDKTGNDSTRMIAINRAYVDAMATGKGR